MKIQKKKTEKRRKEKKKKKERYFRNSGDKTPFRENSVRRKYLAIEFDQMN